MASLTRETIDAAHYVARYAQGRLSDSELEAFEEYCLLHPELVAEVKADRVLIGGIKALSASGELVAPSLQSRQRRQPALRYLAMAASIAALAFVAWRWLVPTTDAALSLYATARDVPSAIAGHELGEPFRLVRTRDSNVPQIDLATDTALVQLELTPSDTAGASHYEVSLQSESDGHLTPRASLARVMPDPLDPDVVRLFLDVRGIDKARVRVELKAEGRPTDVYEIRILRRR